MINDIVLKIKRVTETAKLPTKAHPTDACFDLYCDEDIKEGDKYIVIPARESVILHTGIQTEIPVGYFAPVFSRSGMGFKQDIRLANCVGVIDADYRGEWMVKLVNDSNEPRIIQSGDKIAQFTILPVLDIQLEEVDELETTERGTGGFGSTGK